MLLLLNLISFSVAGGEDNIASMRRLVLQMLEMSQARPPRRTAALALALAPARSLSVPWSKLRLRLQGRHEEDGDVKAEGALLALFTEISR